MLYGFARSGILMRVGCVVARVWGGGLKLNIPTQRKVLGQT